MSYLSPPQNGPKPSSRFASLNVFKLKSGSGRGSFDTAPPPPPKDSSHVSPPNPSQNPPSALYNKPFFSRSVASLSPSLSPESGSVPTTPSTLYPSKISEFGKRSNVTIASANGRAANSSPDPSASGGSLRSFGRGGGDCWAIPSVDGSTDSSGSCPGANPNPGHDMYTLNGANSSSYTMGQASVTGAKFKKGVFKLASLARRNRSKKDLSDTTSASESVSRSVSASEHEDAPASVEGDEGVSLPWNFQHHIHVDEGYIGLPPSWSASLSQMGFDENEIATIHARRRAAATAVISNGKIASLNSASSTERPVSPHAPTVTSPTISIPSTTLLEPIPRSANAARGQETLGVHPLSVCSVTTNTAGGPPSTSRGPSPAPSLKAPSFSMKSIVNGVKNSLTSDSAKTVEVVSGPREGEGATGQESEQYVFVDGNGPEEGRNQGMKDETFIEPFPFDTSSVSSHQSHTSRMQHMSQEQQTPRTPVFPQIQVQRAQSFTGDFPFPSPASRVPSPLSHSTSLPIPTPRGYTYSDHTASPSPSPSHSPVGAGWRSGGPILIPPRTSSRRIYHIANASSDSHDEVRYSEPPPAYVSPTKGEWVWKEKEDLGSFGSPPQPNRSVPVTPIPTRDTLGEPSGACNYNGRKEDQYVSTLSNSDDMTGSTDGIPRTADEVMDITSHYSSSSVHGEDPEMDPAQQVRMISPTPPLVIDKKMSMLATLPPRISFHQESSLEDWSESLFNVIGGKGKRSSILTGSSAADVKEGTVIRPVLSHSMTGEGGNTSAMALNSLSQETVTPSLPDISFGANLTLGPYARGRISVIEEGIEQEKAGKDEAKENDDRPYKSVREHTVDVDTVTTAREDADGAPAASLAPLFLDVFLGPNVSSLGRDLDPPVPTSPPLPKSPRRVSVDSLPPSPPPKPEPHVEPQLKPTTLLPPPAIISLHHRTNVITGISGRSPVNSLFGAKPQPLPIPIPPSQIRAQLRPAPPKPPHPPPTLPLPPLRRAPSQPNLQRSRSQMPPVPSSEMSAKHDFTSSSSKSRPKSSQAVYAIHTNPGGRDSDLSTITVTPATIATAKTEVVRTAVASVLYSDTFSLASGRESVIYTADTESQTLTYGESDIGEQSPRTQEHGEAPDDSVVSETSSVSLLRDGAQSKWPAPPPPPVEMGVDSTPRRVSRFRTTSLGRVSQLQAMNAASSSPIYSHSSHGSSDTIYSYRSSLTTSRGVTGVSTSTAQKTKGGLAAEARMLNSATDTFGGVDIGSEGAEESEARPHPLEIPLLGMHPLLAQLQPYIASRNPTSCFTDLVEIAEGESGLVYAARVVPSSGDARSHEGQQECTERSIPSGTSHVAIKRIPLPSLAFSPSLSDDSPVSNKMVSVLHELSLLKDLDHEHLLLFDAVYVGPNSARDKDTGSTVTVDTSLWIRMELMERSLADVIGLVAEGLALQERLVGRFASDILHGLDYLQKHHIAHRDIRSDNLLVNAVGVVKIADFSNAIRVDRHSATVSGAVGVIYWQAPEMRVGPYNALKVDVWSLGATVWELAETIPPFSMPASPSTQVSFAIQTVQRLGSQWPPLSHPEHYSRAFHEFLNICGRESATRPEPGELLNTPFIRNACGRTVILQLLSQCHAIEEVIAAKEASPNQS